MPAFKDRHTIEDRQGWLRILACAAPQELAARMPGDLPAHEHLRAPEIGAVMVQGRLGGTGAPFNLGEMTVTRCTVRLETGEIGHAMVQGRDRAHAGRVALIDALMQTGRAADLARDLVAPLAALQAARRTARAEKAAATRVDFFTLVRGEDA